MSAASVGGSPNPSGLPGKSEKLLPPSLIPPAPGGGRPSPIVPPVGPPPVSDPFKTYAQNLKDNLEKITRKQNAEEVYNDLRRRDLTVDNLSVVTDLNVEPLPRGYQLVFVGVIQERDGGNQRGAQYFHAKYNPFTTRDHESLLLVKDGEVLPFCLRRYEGGELKFERVKEMPPPRFTEFSSSCIFASVVYVPLPVRSDVQLDGVIKTINDVKLTPVRELQNSTRLIATAGFLIAKGVQMMPSGAVPVAAKDPKNMDRLLEMILSKNPEQSALFSEINRDARVPAQAFEWARILESVEKLKEAILESPYVQHALLAPPFSDLKGITREQYETHFKRWWMTGGTMSEPINSLIAESRIAPDELRSLAVSLLAYGSRYPRNETLEKIIAAIDNIAPSARPPAAKDSEPRYDEFKDIFTRQVYDFHFRSWWNEAETQEDGHRDALIMRAGFSRETLVALRDRLESLAPGNARLERILASIRRIIMPAVPGAGFSPSPVAVPKAVDQSEIAKQLAKVQGLACKGYKFSRMCAPTHIDAIIERLNSKSAERDKLVEAGRKETTSLEDGRTLTYPEALNVLKEDIAAYYKRNALVLGMTGTHMKLLAETPERLALVALLTDGDLLRWCLALSSQQDQESAGFAKQDCFFCSVYNPASKRHFYITLSSLLRELLSVPKTLLAMVMPNEDPSPPLEAYIERREGHINLKSLLDNAILALSGSGMASQSFLGALGPLDLPYSPGAWGIYQGLYRNIVAALKENLSIEEDEGNCFASKNEFGFDALMASIGATSPSEPLESRARRLLNSIVALEGAHAHHVFDRYHFVAGLMDPVANPLLEAAIGLLANPPGVTRENAIMAEQLYVRLRWVQNWYNREYIVDPATLRERTLAPIVDRTGNST